MLDTSGTLTARAFKGSERAATRIARSVAIVIGIALSMQSTAVGQGSIDRYYDLHSLADYQLTDRQLDCNNEITFRESSNRIDARNGSHHTLYNHTYVVHTSNRSRTDSHMVHLSAWYCVSGSTHNDYHYEHLFDY